MSNYEQGAARQPIRRTGGQIDGITSMSGSVTFTSSAVSIDFTVPANGGSISTTETMTNVAAGGVALTTGNTATATVPPTSKAAVASGSTMNDKGSGILKVQLPKATAGNPYGVAVSYDLNTGATEPTPIRLFGTITSVPAIPSGKTQVTGSVTVQ